MKIPILLVQWLYGLDDVEVEGQQVEAISAKEVFETNHIDWVWLKSIKSVVTVITGAEYIEKDIDPKKSKGTFFSRAKYDPAKKEFTPKMDKWDPYCECKFPYNPDKLICQCDGKKGDDCEEWIHPKCFGLDDDDAKNGEVKVLCSEH